MGGSCLIMDLTDISNCHKIYHKFYNYIKKKYGKDLKGEKQVFELEDDNGKKKKISFYNFNEDKLFERLIGYDVQESIKRWVDKYCTDIKYIYCDDNTYSTSMVFFIPHPGHGISILFIPQNTNIKNMFFLYDNHYEAIIRTLRKLKNVYKDERIEKNGISSTSEE